MLREPRSLKPQTERQLAGYLAEHSSSVAGFLLCASEVLEEYELDVLFGPVFTPTLQDRAALADLLMDGPVAETEIRRIVEELSREAGHAMIRMPDGSEARLTLHEVMVDRFVKLLRLQRGPDAVTARSIWQALPGDLATAAIALCCEPGMTAKHQKWFADFVAYVSANDEVTEDLLRTTAEFIAGQKLLEPAALLAAAEALARATEGTAAQAAGGHSYWSADVAQHHQYRGEGKVDRERAEQRQVELRNVTEMVHLIDAFTSTHE